jgi:septal ring factor EnvC (AmiA/AmiB activator)
VARKRLSESLAAATNQLKEATTEAEQAKHQLERAQHELETITARVAELEKQLKALDGPADGS